MKVLLDACVLYPTVMREVLLKTAQAGAFAPLWSERILEEWARAARKLGPEGEAIARGEIALLRAAFPGAVIDPAPRLEARLHLPDPDDVHVLAAAVEGGADALMTLNIRDFPRATLSGEGIALLTPDSYLWQLWSDQPDLVEAAAQSVRARAEAISGSEQPLRALLKKARLPRLAKALAA